MRNFSETSVTVFPISITAASIPAQDNISNILFFSYNIRLVFYFWPWYFWGLALRLLVSSLTEIEKCEFFTSNGLRIRRNSPQAFSQWSASWWNLSSPGHSSDASAERNNREVSNNNPLVTAFNPIGGFWLWLGKHCKIPTANLVHIKKLKSN